MSEKLKAALAYAAAGIRVIPLHHIENGCCTCKEGIHCVSPGKHPRTKDGLDEATTDSDKIRRWWTKWTDANIGGLPNEDWFVLDVDDGQRKNKKGAIVQKEGSAQLEALEADNSPVSKRIVQNTGSGGRHIFLRLPAGRSVPKKIAKDIDTKGHTGYIVLAPSNHISGRNYEWAGFEPAQIGEKLQKLREAPEWLWHNSPDSETGGEDEIELAIANQTKDIDDDTFADAVRNIPNEDDSYDDWLEIGMAIHHQMEGSVEGLELWQEWSRQSDKHDESYTASKWDSFGQHTHRRLKTAAFIIMRAKAAGWMPGMSSEDFADYEDESSDDLLDLLGSSREDTPTPKNQPDMRFIEDSAYPAPKFPLDVLGPFWSNQVKMWAKNTGSVVDFPAASLLAVSAALIGNSRRVQVRKGWEEPCVLWVQVIGTPSSNKSPALDPALRVLRDIENRWAPENQRAKEEWAVASTVAKIKKKTWAAMCSEAVKNNQEPPPMPADAKIPPQPIGRRVQMIDTTIEALVTTAAQNPRGLLNTRDELSGWYSSMTRYAGESSDRPIWLEAYGGRKYISDRVKNEGVPVVVEHFSVSLLGGIQPERLRMALHEGKEAVRDGLQPRFIPVWPEHKERNWTEGVEEDNGAYMALSCLADLPMLHKEGELARPVSVPFSAEARKIFADWYESKTARDGATYGLISDSFGKAEGHVARLALVFEHLWFAQPLSEFDPPPAEISAEAVRAAIRFREEYLKPMQIRTYSMHGRSETEINAMAIADFIRKHEPDYITARMMVREHVLPGTVSTEKVNEAIEYLLTMKWLLPMEKDDRKGSKGGRPSLKFPVNPALWKTLKK